MEGRAKKTKIPTKLATGEALSVLFMEPEVVVMLPQKLLGIDMGTIVINATKTGLQWGSF
jgi:hypothetical protein